MEEYTPKTTDFMPPGKLEVRLVRPPLRFGYGVYVLSVSGGNPTHVAEYKDNGFVFEPFDPYQDHGPTLYASEELINALREALVEAVPAPEKDAVSVHRDDAIKVREEAMGMLKAVIFDRLGSSR